VLIIPTLVMDVDSLPSEECDSSVFQWMDAITSICARLLFVTFLVDGSLRLATRVLLAQYMKSVIDLSLVHFTTSTSLSQTSRASGSFCNLRSLLVVNFLHLVFPLW